MNAGVSSQIKWGVFLFSCELIVEKKKAQKLISRIEQIPLYAHAYAFVLNFEQDEFTAIDLLDFAKEHGLTGICIGTDYGSKKSLDHASKSELGYIKDYAEKLGLQINLEVSSASKGDIDLAVGIARELGIINIRAYIRHGGRLSEVIERGIQELEYISKVAEKNNLHFVLESHEVLKAQELIEIIKKIDSPRVKALLDFGNMINANEKPLTALKVMSPHISQVHLKGAKKKRMGKGYAQIGAHAGEDNIPHKNMLRNLLLLGDLEPQIKCYGLVQQIGYYSPPYRFDNEEQDPLIPDREPSQTYLDGNSSVQEVLLAERENAYKQVKYVKGLLDELRSEAELFLPVSQEKNIA